MLTAEQQARVVIDRLLTAAGWVVQDAKAADVHAGRGVALREDRDLGNEFALKISYRTTSAKPEDLIKAFRTSYYPRIAVTVDMIATGTDIKPVEIVVFMRSVKSRSFFEQMKGGGVRVIKDDDLRGVNPGEHVHKDHFVIVDCVGVCERDKTDSRPMDQKKSVPLDALLQAVSLGDVEPFLGPTDLPQPQIFAKEGGDYSFARGSGKNCNMMRTV